ncbi:unnamed protein product [Musa hybrid cultivar]
MDREHEEEEEEDEGKRRWLHLLFTKWDGLGYDEKAKAIIYMVGRVLVVECFHGCGGPDHRSQRQW